MHHHRSEEAIVPFLDLKRLKIVKFLGRGAKGAVFLVETENHQLLALKAILRSVIEKKENKIDGGKSNGGDGERSDYRRVCLEKDVLASLDHPLLPKLHGVATTEKIIGYAIDYCSGCNLNYLRKKQTEKMFSDDVIRFYAAELLLALEYLHNLGIVYRDLKPENVMIQSNGHLMLVDFDLSAKLAAKSPQQPRNRSPPQPAKPQKITKKRKGNHRRLNCLFIRRDSEITPEEPPPRIDPGTPSGSDDVDSKSFEKSNSFVGTEEYVAPEIILGEGHGFAVDLWCLGVMMYEMLYGTTPFRGANRKETFYRAITRTPDLTGEFTPLRDLIGKLLEKDPRKRISVTEVKEHEFFNGVDWDGLTEMPRPPFIPELTDVEGIDGISDVEGYVERVFEEGKSGNSDHGFVNDTNHSAAKQRMEKEVFIF